MTKSILILNGSHSDIPLIQAAKALNYHVITTGHSPELIGHQYGDAYHSQDFSNLEGVYQLARTLKVDAICACANDFGALSAAYAAEKLGLPGHDSYQTSCTLHQKDLFKAFMQKHNLPTPQARWYQDRDAAQQDSWVYPVIVKPVDLTGGKGITKVTTPEDYAAAITTAFHASRVQRIVVEHFVTGTQHSLSTYLVGKKVRFTFSDNEYSFTNPYLVSSSAAPATAITKVQPDLIKTIERIASLLDLTDGLFHVQYILDESGCAHIIETTRRCSGDMYPWPVQYATGVDWAQWIVKAEAGLDVSDFPTGVQQTGFYGRHCIMSPHNGEVADVHIDPSLQENIVDQLIWWQPGDCITDFSTHKLGILGLRFNSAQEMQDKIHNIHTLVQVILR